MSKNTNIKSVFGIVVSESEVLFLKRSENTSRPGQWNLPGGGIKHKETPEDACLREILEESGLSVSIIRSVAVYSDTRYFLCSLSSKKTSIQLALDECNDYVWCVPKDCLRIGEIMDLSRLIPMFSYLGFVVPELPDGLTPSHPCYTEAN